jgi:hypothetical protein
MFLPEDRGKNFKELSEIIVQNYTPALNLLETLKCTTCHPILNLKITREFVLLLVDSRENWAYIFPEGD